MPCDLSGTLWSEGSSAGTQVPRRPSNGTMMPSLAALLLTVAACGGPQPDPVGPEVDGNTRTTGIG